MHLNVSKISCFPHFFSNSPFHKTFKELSERIWAPMSGGLQIKNKWYYERTRGQYLNEKAKYSRDGKEKEFLLRYPKEQMIDKHVLAKTEMIFSNFPHLSTKTNQAFPIVSYNLFCLDVSILISLLQ